jgi:hypothetical protein
MREDKRDAKKLSFLMLRALRCDRTPGEGAQTQIHLYVEGRFALSNERRRKENRRKG